MRFTHQQYAQALYESLQDTKPKDHDIVIENFVGLLKKNGDLAEYERVIAVFEAYDKEQRGIKEVEITTAHDGKLNKSILDHLNKLVGKDREIKHKVDENLIGGVVIRVEDTLIDASTKRQLEDLEQSLRNS